MNLLEFISLIKKSEFDTLQKLSDFKNNLWIPLDSWIDKCTYTFINQDSSGNSGVYNIFYLNCS